MSQGRATLDEVAHSRIASLRSQWWRQAVSALAACVALYAGSALADPTVRILDLPFKVREMRGPRSEIALAVTTSGLLPIAHAKGAADGPIAVVWGEEGGAILTLASGSVAVKPIGREAVEDLVASETPRGALPGSRRALDGALSAYLTGRVRAPDGSPAAATLTVRERQPMAVSSDPKPVPVATATVQAGGDTVFAPQPPRILHLSGNPAILVATLSGTDAGGLALVTRQPGEPAGWRVSARTLLWPHLSLAAVADFSKAGTPQAATVDSRGMLRLWTLAAERIEPGPEAPGYTLGEGEADLADALVTAGAAELVLPVAGRPAIAVISVGATLRERLRVDLPAPAGTGLAVLGEGPGARLVVGLGDGRVAAVALDGGQP